MFYVFLIIFESSKNILDDIFSIYDIGDFHPNVVFNLKLLMLINFSDYASALASAYLLFKDSDSAYAATLLGE
jgi:hypothetical protein